MRHESVPVSTGGHLVQLRAWIHGEGEGPPRPGVGAQGGPHVVVYLNDSPALSIELPVGAPASGGPLDVARALELVRLAAWELLSCEHLGLRCAGLARHGAELSLAFTGRPISEVVLAAREVVELAEPAASQKSAMVPKASAARLAAGLVAAGLFHLHTWLLDEKG